MAKKVITLQKRQDSDPPPSEDLPVAPAIPVAERARSVESTENHPEQDAAIVSHDVDEPQIGGGPDAGKGRSRYDHLLHCIYDAVLVTDFDGNIIQVNSMATRRFSRSAEDLQQMNVLQLISGATPQLLKMVRDNAANRKYTVLEAVALCGEDTGFHAEIAVNKMDAESLCFFVRDITHRKQMEEQLKRASDKLIESVKLQSRLDTISTLSYELNNPLQILISMAELNKEPEYKKQIDRIIEVLGHLHKRDELEVVIDGQGDSLYSVPPTVREVKTCDHAKLLIADDEPLLRRMFCAVLGSAFPELHIETADNGQEAVALFTKGHHGLIIMDVAMPVMTGEEAFAEIKQFCEREAWQMPAILFCTGFIVTDSLDAILKSGPSLACLRKPLSVDELTQTVRQFLQPEL